MYETVIVLPTFNVAHTHRQCCATPIESAGKMLGTSEGSFYLLSKLWKKSPQTGFSGHGHEHFLYKAELRMYTLCSLKAQICSFEPLTPIRSKNRDNCSPNQICLQFATPRGVGLVVLPLRFALAVLAHSNSGDSSGASVFWRVSSS